MARQVLRQVKVASSRDARRKYLVTFYKGGAVKAACSCPGWIHYHKDCKHIKGLRKGWVDVS